MLKLSWSSTQGQRQSVQSFPICWIGYRVGGDIKYDDGAFKLNFDLTNGQNVANEFRPVNYSVYYIMKIK